MIFEDEGTSHPFHTPVWQNLTSLLLAIDVNKDFFLTYPKHLNGVYGYFLHLSVFLIETVYPMLNILNAGWN